jgi:hypothetical protein
MFKNGNSLVWAAGMLYLLAALTACPIAEENDPGGGRPPHTPYTPQTEQGERFQTMMRNQYDALAEMLDTIALYYSQDYLKSLSNGEPLRLEDFSTYFDADKTRTITDEYGNRYTTTLGREMAETAQVFLGELSLLKSDLGPLLQLDGVVYDNGNLMVPELDMIINTDSPAGILELELKIADLNGVDMRAFANDMNAVSDDYIAQMTKLGGFTAGGVQTGPNRAIYKTTDLIYEGGRVYYSWGDFGLNNIEAAHKTALREAMTDWENAVNDVGGHIQFIDKTNDVLHQTLATIGLTKLRVMISGNLFGLASGMAIWGGFPGRAHLTLTSGLRHQGERAFGLYKTARHELGHVLGLRHEHQRWDRDDYITLPSYNNLIDQLCGSFNSIKLKEFFSISLPFLKFKWVSVNCGWFKIWLPIPYFAWIEIDLFRLADSYGKFDYNSIMLYSSNKMKQDFTGLEYYWTNGIGSFVESKSKKYTSGDYVPVNAKISADDARTVKKIYENDFWFR